MEFAYTLHLPHDPRAPGIARATLRAVLKAHDLTRPLCTAEMLVSEMVTNAYVHSGGPSAMRVRGLGGRLRVSVWDTDPAFPVLFDDDGLDVLDHPGDPDAEHGRGLLLVKRFADDWGGYALTEELFGVGGKLLWFEMAA
ncbi:hypothetical protein GCM10027168_66010 [Streptomyces capparidis]